MALTYIYVAGPLTTGDQDVNTAEAIRVADILLCNGFAPFVPHLDRTWHLLHHHPYETWMGLCLKWVTRCDAVLRLPGQSAGADREVALARQLDRPVFGGEDYPVGAAVQALFAARGQSNWIERTP